MHLPYTCPVEAALFCLVYANVCISDVISHQRLSKVLKRAAKLAVLGWLTASATIKYNGQGLNLSSFRVPGILVRIAWANLVCALMASDRPPPFFPHALCHVGVWFFEQLEYNDGGWSAT